MGLVDDEYRGMRQHYGGLKAVYQGRVAAGDNRYNSISYVTALSWLPTCLVQSLLTTIFSVLTLSCFSEVSELIICAEHYKNLT